jgi:hypothetical protein
MVVVANKNKRISEEEIIIKRERACFSLCVNLKKE